MERQKKWRNVFANSKAEGLDSIFDKLGQQFEPFFDTLTATSRNTNLPSKRACKAF